MPTHEETEQFWRDWAALSPEQQTKLRGAVRRFLADLPGGRFRSGLRVRGVQGARGVFEMTWAPDGRATFEFGPAKSGDEPHIIWRRIGTHSVFTDP